MTVLAELRHVHFAWPDRPTPTLNDVNWSIPQGAVTLLVGKSGTGKSTLLRCLNGLVPHFSGGRFGGEVVVAGRSTRHHGPRDLARQVGFVFQDPESQMLMDRVDREIALGMEHAGVNPVIMRKRVEEALDLLGIPQLRDRDPATLSGGERQRVAIASVMAMHPAMLVLDEPTSQLDPWGGEEVTAALTRFSEDLGMTVVLSEHRLERVLSHADAVRLIDDDGRMTDGSPGEIARIINPVALPAVSQLGRQLAWGDIPLTVKDARRAPAFSALQAALADRRPPDDRPTPGGSLLVARGMAAGHDQRALLREIDLTVHEGEMVAVMGRNGSGKTTLLRAIMGFHLTTAGWLQLGESPLPAGDVAARAGRIGYVPQQPLSLFSCPTLAQELELSARARGVAVDLAAVLAAVDLADKADRHPADLSVGERQRAAIAAVLAGQPQVLLLDEPTRGMDPWHKRQLVRALAEVRSRGIGVLMATHDVELVAESADAVVLLGDGGVVASGAPREVLTGSLSYSTQINRVFGGRWLTVADVVSAVR